MLGFVTQEARGALDALLFELAERLQADGIRLAGAVQRNTDLPGELRCQMDLQLLPSGTSVRISQRLGAEAKGCRLDPEGLQQAVHHAERALEDGAQLLLINKFGKQEIEGRGFRLLIGAALAEGVPVLLGVNPKNIEGFQAFAGSFAEQLPAELAALRNWAHRNTRDAGF